MIPFLGSWIVLISFEVVLKYIYIYRHPEWLPVKSLEARVGRWRNMTSEIGIVGFATAIWEMWLESDIYIYGYTEYLMWSVDALILYAVIKSASITPMKMLQERDRNTPSLERFILAGWAAAAGRAMDSWGGELAG